MVPKARETFPLESLSYTNQFLRKPSTILTPTASRIIYNSAPLLRAFITDYPPIVYCTCSVMAPGSWAQIASFPKKAAASKAEGEEFPSLPAGPAVVVTGQQLEAGVKFSWSENPNHLVSSFLCTSFAGLLTTSRQRSICLPSLTST